MAIACAASRLRGRHELRRGVLFNILWSAWRGTISVGKVSFVRCSGNRWSDDDACCGGSDRYLGGVKVPGIMS